MQWNRISESAKRKFRSLNSKSKNIRWSMLLSHHAPCDYDRTWRVCGVRICVRCLGMAFGAVIGLVIAIPVCPRQISAMNFVVTVALIMPAVLDFAAHELHSEYTSNNFKRFFSGVLFGMPGGVCLLSACRGQWLPVLLLITFFAFLEIALAVMFFLTGHLESYIARYERAVWIDEQKTSKSQNQIQSVKAD